MVGYLATAINDFFRQSRNTKTHEVKEDKTIWQHIGWLKFSQSKDGGVKIAFTDHAMRKESFSKGEIDAMIGTLNEIKSHIK